MGQQKGFSLIELLIVVAIILIIAAIAVPNLLRSRIAAQDSAAAATVRTLNTSEITFSTTYPTAGYASLAVLGPNGNSCPGSPSSTGSCLIDQILGCTAGVSGASCSKDNYNFTITLPSSNDYVIYAGPTSKIAGDKDFCSAPDSVVRSRADTSASNTAIGTDTTCTALSSI